MKVADPSAVDPESVAAHAFEIGDRHSISVSEVIVFGSVARAKNDDRSDADLVVVSPDFDGVEYHERPHAFLWEWDREQFGTPDVVPLTPRELEIRSEDPSDIVHEADRSGDTFSEPPRPTA